MTYICSQATEKILADIERSESIPGRDIIGNPNPKSADIERRSCGNYLIKCYNCQNNSGYIINGLYICRICICICPGPDTNVHRNNYCFCNKCAYCRKPSPSHGCSKCFVMKFCSVICEEKDQFHKIKCGNRHIN